MQRSGDSMHSTIQAFEEKRPPSLLTMQSERLILMQMAIPQALAFGSDMEVVVRLKPLLALHCSHE